MIDVSRSLVNYFDSFLEDERDDLLFDVIPTVLKPDASAFYNEL